MAGTWSRFTGAALLPGTGARGDPPDRLPCVPSASAPQPAAVGLSFTFASFSLREYAETGLPSPSRTAGQNLAMRSGMNAGPGVVTKAMAQRLGSKLSWVIGRLSWSSAGGRIRLDRGDLGPQRGRNLNGEVVIRGGEEGSAVLGGAVAGAGVGPVHRDAPTGGVGHLDCRH